MFTVEQVEPYARVPYILTGYRSSGKWSDLFRWHNETLNAWTLLIVPIISWSIYIWYGRWNFILLSLPLRTTFQVPFGVGNHIFYNSDYFTHIQWRVMDLCATHIASFVLCVILSYSVYRMVTFLVVCSIQSLVCGYLISCEYQYYQKVSKGEPAVWNIFLKTGMVAVEVGICLSPYVYVGDLVACILTIGSLCLGGIVYGLGIPERFFPGKFDYIGHGNTLMHLTLIIGHIGEYYFILRNLM